MALAWVSWSPERRAFEVETGSNRFYELYLSTRPELFQPQLASSRTPDNFYSSRAASGLLPSSGGRALFPLPERLGRQLPNGSVYFVVKTFADESGRSPALSPVFGGTSAHVVLSDVDPAGGTTMGMIDFEERAARIAPPAPVPNGRGSVRAMSAAATRGRSPRRGSRPAGRAAAEVLAQTCRQVREACAADPTIPGKPTYQSVVEAMSAAFSLVPTPGSDPLRGPSLAATLTAEIEGGPPRGDGQRLARHIMRAGRRSSEQAFAREQFLPALASLAPILLQALPTILPMIMPLIQKLLGGLSGAKSLGAPADPQASGIQQLLAAVAAAAAKQAPPAGAPAAAPPQAAPAPVPPAQAAPSPPPAPLPTAEVATPAAAPAAIPAMAPAADGGGIAGSGVSPEQAAALLGQLQGFGGQEGGLFGAITGHSASPGTDMLKSVVDRLPIDKMFDPKTWMPDSSKYDEWRATMPWQAVLSLSEPTAAFGSLFVPGKTALKPLADVRLDFVNRALTKTDEGGESWTFLADQPARLQLEVVAGPQGLTRPFVDVRVSRDGTPSGGIWRAAFRMDSLGSRERGVVTIEIPPDVLARAATDGTETCISARVIQQSGTEYEAAELRGCFYVVNPHSVVVEPGAFLGEASELEAVAGLERQIPITALGTEIRAVDWALDVVPRAALTGIARYLPVGQRSDGGGATLEGGLVLSSLGLADLAKRSGENGLGAEEISALAEAIDASADVRNRMSLRARETLEPQVLARAEKALGVRVEMGWLPAQLVSFTGAGPDGNPSRRAVKPIRVPIARGIALRAV